MNKAKHSRPQHRKHINFKPIILSINNCDDFTVEAFSTFICQYGREERKNNVKDKYEIDEVVKNVNCSILQKLRVKRLI